MAIQGNAFALLDDDDAENLLARLSTAAVEAPPAVDKRKAKKKKPVTSSLPSSQPSTAAPQRFSDHEKGRQGTERNNRNGFVRQTIPVNNRDGGFVRQTRTVNNRDGVERHNRNGVEANGGVENGSRHHGHGEHVFKRNNVYRHDERPAADGLKRRDGNSNGYHYQKKQETTNGHQKKQETTNGVTNDHQKKQETINGDTNGHQEKEESNDDGWQTVRRPNGHKQNNVNHWQAPKDGNVERKERNNNGNGNEVKVLDDKQHQNESGENGVSGGILEKPAGYAGKVGTDYRMRNGGNGRANRGGYGRGGERGGHRVIYQRRGADEGEKNEKSSEPVELVIGGVQKGGGDAANAGPEGDETASKDSSKEKHDTALIEKENERLAELELEAKRMTLKEYEKMLEEKRKTLESLKTEERRVALDKELESMHMIEKKIEEANSVKMNSAGEKLKKKAVNHKDGSNAPKLRNLFRPPPGRRGGRHPSRNANSEGAGKPDAPPPPSTKPHVPPPSFTDANQFPALA